MNRRAIFTTAATTPTFARVLEPLRAQVADGRYGSCFPVPGPRRVAT
jgi:hypothetical protein